MACLFITGTSWKTHPLFPGKHSLLRVEGIHHLQVLPLLFLLSRPLCHNPSSLLTECHFGSNSQISVNHDLAFLSWKHQQLWGVLSSLSTEMTNSASSHQQVVLAMFGRQVLTYFTHARYFREIISPEFEKCLLFMFYVLNNCYSSELRFLYLKIFHLFKFHLK